VEVKRPASESISIRERSHLFNRILVRDLKLGDAVTHNQRVVGSSPTGPTLLSISYEGPKKYLCVFSFFCFHVRGISLKFIA
jgi:hypothetical protein